SGQRLGLGYYTGSRETLARSRLESPSGVLLPAACERTYKSNMDSREMARKRWQGVSRKKRSEAMRKLALKRWRARETPGEAAPDELEKLIRLRFPPEK